MRNDPIVAEVRAIRDEPCEHPTQLEKPDEGVPGVRIG